MRPHERGLFIFGEKVSSVSNGSVSNGNAYCAPALVQLLKIAIFTDTAPKTLPRK
jgi:hypothetical protein